jgi:hypothetical protein
LRKFSWESAVEELRRDGDPGELKYCNWARQGGLRIDGAVVVLAFGSWHLSGLTRVLHGWMLQEDLSPRSWRISTVISRCQGRAGWRRGRLEKA